MKQLTIDGVPVAKGRPRLGRYGTYTPKKHRNMKNMLKPVGYQNTAVFSRQSNH